MMENMDWRPRVMTEYVEPEYEFALQVNDKFDKYWIQYGKYYMQRGGEPVWHEISQVKYDKAYDVYQLGIWKNRSNYL